MANITYVLYDEIRDDKPKGFHDGGNWQKDVEMLAVSGGR